MPTKWITALPVFNEVRHVNRVLDEVSQYSPEILVIDDGSSDGTADLVAARGDVAVVTHPENRGYGAALRSAFEYAAQHGYEYLVTIDCDGQHEPQRIPDFVRACRGVDIVSGSRYLRSFPGDSEPPAQRLWINQQITSELNRRLGLCLTDAFCGFKAYRVGAVSKLQLTENGYAMPLELWVQAARARLRIMERPVPLIYLDEKRSFGGTLDNATTRLQYYHDVLDRSIAAAGGELRVAQKTACGECR
jgi:glycosyltransferase involved in cell wall biosynthesis